MLTSVFHYGIISDASHNIRWLRTSGICWEQQLGYLTYYNKLKQGCFYSFSMTVIGVSFVYVHRNVVIVKVSLVCTNIDTNVYLYVCDIVCVCV